MSLSPDERRYFERLLRRREEQLMCELELARQREEAETFRQLAGDVADRGDESLAQVVADTTHAERQRDTEELREVRDALDRLEAGTYGVCQRCGKPINRQRLEAVPFVRYDLEHQKEQEGPVVRPTPKL